MTTEALGHREQERDDAERLLAMLRVTLTERVEDHFAELDRGFPVDDLETMRLAGRIAAYRDVLCLLGPEETYVDDGTEPF